MLSLNSHCHSWSRSLAELKSKLGLVGAVGSGWCVATWLLLGSHPIHCGLIKCLPQICRVVYGWQGQPGLVWPQVPLCLLEGLLLHLTKTQLVPHRQSNVPVGNWVDEINVMLWQLGFWEPSFQVFYRVLRIIIELIFLTRAGWTGLAEHGVDCLSQLWPPTCRWLTWWAASVSLLICLSSSGPICIPS